MDKTNKPLMKIISEIQPENLSNEEIKEIVNKILSIKYKTTQDIETLFSKLHNIKIDDIDLPLYIIINNKKLNFNLSQNQILSIIEKSNLSEKDYSGQILPM